MLLGTALLAFNLADEVERSQEEGIVAEYYYEQIGSYVTRHSWVLPPLKLALLSYHGGPVRCKSCPDRTPPRHQASDHQCSASSFHHEPHLALS